MGDNSTITLALFGASGRTGRHIVALALEKGWKVQAMVRSPEKFDIQHLNLTVIQGDVSNDEAIQSTVKGATYVISCAGGPHNHFKYEKMFMSRFVKEKLWPLLQQEKPKAFLFQAGALSKTYWMPTFPQLVVAPFMGLWPMARDNDAVMKFIHQNKQSLAGTTRVVVTRPGALRQGSGGVALKATYFGGNMAPICFVDLARFTLEAVEDETLDGKYPYVTRR